MKVCVFCGSSMGNDPRYQEAAAQLGEVLAQNDCTLYYGGANVGLMKIIADKMLERGKRVVGIIPKLITDMEIAHEGVTEMIEVDTMSERKLMLISESDAFIAMPGGFGTLDEIFEITVQNQLRISDKPVALYNTLNYYDSMIQFIDHAVSQGFIRKEHRDNIVVSDNPETLFKELSRHKSIDIDQWIQDIKEESK
ncbi:MAG: TIGR00730 family Rossman fold protein [Bacteroidales bacterium]|nr:TIGR00730 family Rossman fold protein [Bacteroidales bacterium]MBR5781012.1 TIGR00730 family Rossman fold protein [Bacteroidales bacterium]